LEDTNESTINCNDVLLTVIICAGCSNDSLTNNDSPPDIASADSAAMSTLTGELKIADCFDSRVNGASVMAAGFMKLHPNVSIIVDSANINYEEAADFDPLTAFRQRIGVQLMSGEKAPDIVAQAYAIDIGKAASSGMIIDLYPYWNNDPDIVKEDYFINVLKANEYGNGLYAIPTMFTVSIGNLNKRVTEPLGIDIDALDSISVTELLDIYLEALDKGIISDDFWFMYGYSGKNSITGFIQRDYLDNKSQKAYFNTPEFIEYLEKSNRIPTSRSVLNSNYESTSIKNFEEKNNAFFMQGSTSFDNHMLFDSASSLTSGGILLTKPSGRAHAHAYQNYAISSSCKNPELAWEFIKYCIIESDEAPFSINAGEMNGDRWFSINPLNRNNFRKHMQACMKDSFTEETYQQYLTWAEMVTELDTEMNMEQLEILALYYDAGLITADECARRMQERADIYFME